MTTAQTSTPPADGVTESALDVLRANTSTLTTAVNAHLEETLSWYRQLSTDERASLRLISQRGIHGLVNWLDHPSARSLPLVNELLGAAPTDLLRTISLQRALQLIRSIVAAVEDRLPGIMPPADQRPMLEAVLRYSREVAFAIADVYARAAESRGAWDSRLEALLVDAVLRGEPAEQIASRAAAAGWRSGQSTAIVVGAAPEPADAAFMRDLRLQCVRFAADAVVGVQGNRLILLLGGVTDLDGGLERILSYFGPGNVVFSRLAGALSQAHPCAQAAYSGFTAAAAWTQAPRLIAAADLLPERALAGDESAKKILGAEIYDVLAAAGNALLETVTTYVESGRSLEATARELYVHTNTVRYRLRKVTEVTSWDPMVPRESYVLQTALAVGRL